MKNSAVKWLFTVTEKQNIKIALLPLMLASGVLTYAKSYGLCRGNNNSFGSPCTAKTAMENGIKKLNGERTVTL